MKDKISRLLKTCSGTFLALTRAEYADICCEWSDQRRKIQTLRFGEFICDILLLEGESFDALYYIKDRDLKPVRDWLVIVDNDDELAGICLDNLLTNG